MRLFKLITTCLFATIYASCLYAQEDFKTVKIGKQVWMAENLNVCTFQNGDTIPEIKVDSLWYKAGFEGKPAWCYYNNDSATGRKYGRLYNWYAVNDKRGLAPKGWHIPSDTEWVVLATYLGGKDSCGKKMKSKTEWAENGNGDDSSGFNGLPGGERAKPFNFFLFSKGGFYWSSTEKNSKSSWNRSLSYTGPEIFRANFNKSQGMSIRCIKD
ncbi:MAG: fibrobacter succinogenes major paralogous domain-containing protein [Bacteroidia bacterium]